MSLFATRNLKYLDILSYPDIELGQGIFTFITGPSGCGKSTLLRILNATALPTQGSVLYCDADIDTLDVLEHRKKVLLAAQEFFLFDASIKENFMQYYKARGTQLAAEEHMKKMLAVCCVEFGLDTQCHTLSGGERQRVFLAICLSFSPEVILLDEPTSALDRDTAFMLMQNLANHCKGQGITPVAICHSPELVERFADEVVDLSKGVRV